MPTRRSQHSQQCKTATPALFLRLVTLTFDPRNKRVSGTHCGTRGMSSSVTLAASVFEIPGGKQTHRQTAVKPVPVRLRRREQLTENHKHRPRRPNKMLLYRTTCTDLHIHQNKPTPPPHRIHSDGTTFRQTFITFSHDTQQQHYNHCYVP